MKISKKLQFGKFVTPIPDKQRPVYRWFQLKESFSSHLVLTLLDLWKPDRNSLVLDPFCGAGTTLLACKEAGLSSIGFDVHPLFLFASRVKTSDYDLARLHQLMNEIIAVEVEPGEIAPEWVRKFFPPKIPELILSLKEKILKLEERERNFFLLALMKAALHCSWAEVDGAVLKVRKRKVKPLLTIFKEVTEGMLEDLRNLPTKPAKVRIERCDARRMNLPDESIDITITSPPYLFKGEYIRAYKIEEWILDVQTNIESFFGGWADDSSPEEYFSDMARFMEELFRVSRSAAKVCLVISDGCSKRGVVKVIEKVSEIAKDVGFSVKKAILVNERWCTTPSRRKLGKAGEYLLMLEKK
ncbi:MAG: DNA methyltransferase [Candidatus Hadarchaeales archaeon]